MLRVVETIDRRVVGWMSKNGIRALRLSLGVIFFWFGFLKFFPGLSPAEELAARTIMSLTFDIISKHQALLFIATLESIIGIGLILGIYPRAILFLLFVQMAGTFTPLVLFPSETFVRVPFAPTLEGQYIIKNLVLISAGIVIGATVRGTSVKPDPKVKGGKTRFT